MNKESNISNQIVQQNKITKALLNRFIAGDDAAFSELYDLYINILYNYGLRLTTDKELLKDCIHEVFIKIYHKREDLSTVDNLRSYLFISLKNKVCDEIRKLYYISDVSSEDCNPADTDDIEGTYISKEKEMLDLKLVSDLMGQLSPRQRQALTLYYIEERKYEDICVIMDMNYQSVRNLMHRGLQKMRSLVG